MREAEGGPTGRSVPRDAHAGRSAAPDDRDAVSLALYLRSGTRSLHDAVERCTGWPASIRDEADYRGCLRGLVSVWRPFEAAFARGGAASVLGLRRASRLAALESDLRLLGDDPASVPALAADIAGGHAGSIGAIYVLEGSALGGRLIGADLRRRLGDRVGAATTFFAGHPGPSWRETARAIDAFGAARPDEWTAVLGGARQAFTAFLQVFETKPCRS